MNKSSIGFSSGAVLVLVALVVVAGIWYFSADAPNPAYVPENTYVSVENGFQIKYPDGVDISEIANKASIANWNILFFRNEEKLPFQDWFIFSFDREKNRDCNFLSSNLPVAEEESYFVSKNAVPDDCFDAGYYIVSEGGERIAKFEIGQDLTPGEEFSGMISTFEFLEK